MRALLLCLVVSFLHVPSLALEEPEDLLSKQPKLNSDEDLSLNSELLPDHVIKSILKKYIGNGDQVEISDLNTRNLNDEENKLKLFRVQQPYSKIENTGRKSKNRRTKKYKVVVNRRSKYNKSDKNVNPKYILRSKENYYPIIKSLMPKFKEKVANMQNFNQNNNDSLKSIVTKLNDVDTVIPIKENEFIAKVSETELPYELETNNRENNHILSKQVSKDNNLQINNLMHEYAHEITEPRNITQSGNNQVWEVIRDDKKEPIKEEEIIVLSIQPSEESLQTLYPNGKYKYQILSEPDVKIVEQNVKNDLITSRQIATVSNANKITPYLYWDLKEKLVTQSPSYEIPSEADSKQTISTSDEMDFLRNDDHDQSRTKNTVNGDNKFYSDRLGWPLYSSRGIQESIKKSQLSAIRNILLQLCEHLENAPDFSTFLNHYLGLDQPQHSEQLKKLNGYLKILLKMIENSNLDSLPPFVLLLEISDYIDRMTGVQSVVRDKTKVPDIVDTTALRSTSNNFTENSNPNNEQVYHLNELISALLKPYSPTPEKQTLDSSKHSEKVSVSSLPYQSVEPIFLEVTTPGSIKEPDIDSKRILKSGDEGFGSVSINNNKTADSIAPYSINADLPVVKVVANNNDIEVPTVLNKRFKESENIEEFEGEPENLVTNLPGEAVVYEKPIEIVPTKDLKISVVSPNYAAIENPTEESKNSNNLHSLEMDYERPDWLFSNSSEHNPSISLNEDSPKFPEEPRSLKYANLLPIEDEDNSFKINKFHEGAPNVLNHGDLQQVIKILEIAGINPNQKSKGKPEIQYIFDRVPYEDAEKVILAVINKIIQLFSARNVPIKLIHRIIGKILNYVFHAIEDHEVKCPAKVRYDNFVKNLKGQVSHSLSGIDNKGQNAKFNRRMLQDIIESSVKNILKELPISVSAKGHLLKMRNLVSIKV